MIDTQAIRKKILDLAFRGKLTEQLPEDGTAEELYQQIQVEKQAKIKAGIIKKEKPLPEIVEDEIPFEIPDNWKWVRLGEFGSWHAGATPSRGISKYYNGSIPWLKTGELNDGYISSVSEHITELALKECSVQLNPIGSVLIAMYGATIGKLGIADMPLTTNQACCACVPYDGIYNRFLFFLLMFMRKTFIEMGIGGAQSNISREKIVNAVVPLPPTAEQKRVVEKIEQAFSVLDTIDELQAQYADNLTALKSKHIDLAIRGKLTEQLPEDGTAEELYQQIQEEKQALIKSGKIKKEKPLPEIAEDEIPFEIPDNWKWVRLGEIARVLGGKRIPAGRSLTQEDTGHKYIRVSEMKNRTVITDGLLYVPEDIYSSISQYIIKKEDVYITVAGTIGRVGKIPAEIDGANLTENADRIVFSNLDQDWLILCLSSFEVQKQIELLTTSVAQPKLAIKRIQEFRVPLPPLAEQKRIVERLDQILAVCDELK